MTTKKFPPLDLDTSFWKAGQVYTTNKYGYTVESIWEAAKDLPTYEVPLIGFHVAIAPWSGVESDFKTFLIHAKLCQEADMSFPIILDPGGDIADGRHRLGKAIMEGHSTIKIKRLQQMPEPAYEFDDAGGLTALFDTEAE